MLRLDRHAVGGRGAGDPLPPVEIARTERGARLLALQHDAALGLRGDSRDRLVEQRLVGHDAARLDAAGRGQHDARRGVLDPLRQLGRREAAEHHRVDGAETRAGEHREDGLGHHRHVEQHAVAARDAEARERAREPRHLLLQLGVAEAPPRAGDGALVDQRDLVAAPRGDVAVDGVVAGVQHAARKPGRAQRIAVLGALRPAHPVDRIRGAQPELLGPFARGALLLGQPAHEPEPVAARPSAALQRAAPSAKRCASAPRLPRWSAA